MGTTILTSQSRYINFLNLEENVYDIIDIAQALSKICRFCGHCDNFYSVAQHSVLVSEIVPPEYAFEGLLHDATEAYLGDISSPLKRLLPEYKRIEKAMYKEIAKTYSIPEETTDVVKRADEILLATEKRDIMPYDPTPEEWSFLEGTIPLEKHIIPVSDYYAFKLFMNRYNYLKSNRTNK